MVLLVGITNMVTLDVNIFVIPTAAPRKLATKNV